MTKIVSTYKPRPLQDVMHKDKSRFKVAVCHRRFGKTVFSINHLIRQAYQCKLDDPQYLFIAPKKQQAKDVAWKPFKKALEGFPNVVFKEAELRIEIKINDKSTISILVRGADDYDNLRGLYLDGAVIDEVADMPKAAWESVIRPALSDRRGWALFIGTPKGKNYFKELYLRGVNKNKNWASFLFKASETGYIAPEELEDLKATTDEELYAQEYECSFEASLAGSYYGKLLSRCRVEDRIGEFSIDPSLPVVTAWDIGLNDKTCIWFAQQYSDGTITLFDYYEASGETMNHYINIVHNKGYKYAYHILPHDVQHRNWSTGNTRRDELHAAGLNVRVAPKLSIDDGITAVRSILPKCRFDEKTCDEGLNALSYYHSIYDDKRDVQRLVPEHDWSSHAADAFRYLAVALSPNRKQNPIKQSLSRFSDQTQDHNKYDASYGEFDI